MATSKLNLSYKDHDGEIGSVGFRFTQLTALNFDAQMTLMDALVTAVGNVVLGGLNIEGRVAIYEDNNPVYPADPWAQRETKWLVRARDAVTADAVTFELPCADLSLLLAGTDRMDTSGGAGAALVTAIEDGVLSKNGNAVEVQEIIHVGRNI